MGVYKCPEAKLVSSGHGVLLCVLQFISFSWFSFPCSAWALPAQGPSSSRDLLINLTDHEANGASWGTGMVKSHLAQERDWSWPQGEEGREDGASRTR